MFFKSLGAKEKVAVFVLLAAFLSGFTVTAFAFRSPKGFVDAQRLLSKQFLQQVIAENYLGTQPLKPKVLKVTRNLYIFDFNSSALCGSGGCLYAVYTGEAKRVLLLYLHPTLPPSIELFAVDSRQQNGFPCLLISQPSFESNEIVESRFCYQAGSFISVFQQLKKVD